MLSLFCKKHFAIKQFCPLHENPLIFVISQWQTDKTQPSLIYLTYRTLTFLLFFITWIITIVRQSGEGKWPIFLTNWGYTICTLQALLGFGMLLLCVLAPRLKNMPNLKEKTLIIYPAYWILHTIATPLAFGITFMYWTVIYDANVMTFDAMNYFVHGNNSVLMMIELWIVSHPIRILHFLYPAIFGFLYTMFSIIYYFAGGTNRDGSKCIYKILDWDKPLSTTITCLGVIVFLMVLHVFTFFVCKLKRMLYEQYTSKNLNDCCHSKNKRQTASTNRVMYDAV